MKLELVRAMESESESTSRERNGVVVRDVGLRFSANPCSSPPWLPLRHTIMEYGGLKIFVAVSAIKSTTSERTARQYK